MEVLKLDLFYRLECEHRVCKECVIGIIRSSTEDYNTAFLRCPEVDCKREMSRPFIVDKLTAHRKDEVLARFQKIVRDQELVKDPTLLHCVKPGCNNVMKVADRKRRMMFRCDRCQAKFCGRCGLEEHDKGMCLVDSEENFKEMIASHKLVNCPSCHVPVEKVFGCNQMTCSMCRYSFCWLCKRKYTSTHFAKFNILFGCPGMLGTNPFNVRKVRIKYTILTLCSSLALILAIHFIYKQWSYFYTPFRIVLSLIMAAIAYLLSGRRLSDSNIVLLAIINYMHFEAVVGPWAFAATAVLALVLIDWLLGRGKSALVWQGFKAYVIKR